MKNLNDLIKLHGNPSALIDNFESSDTGYAIWGYKNIIKYNLQSTFINNKKVGGDPFELLQFFLDTCLKSDENIKSIGFIGYDIKNYLFPHIKFKISKTNAPCLWFAQPKKIQKYHLEKERIYQKSVFLELKQDILSLEKYKKIISEIKRELKKGNTYQINLTANKFFQYSNISPFEIYLKIRDYVKPAFGYFINTGDEQILSFSPEQFFKTKGSKIESFPMKGTHKRSSNKDKDIFYKNKLKQSEKDKAEHLMIVDLLRNDIGKICKYGSVKVKNLFKVNSYATVHQMISCIYGQLKENIKYIDIFKALCPGGSITGAPKESSMQIIDRLENYNREIYTGNIGHIDNNGDMHFNIAIRTMVAKKNIIEYSVGGGIVWDSDPNKEWKEAQLKSKILDNFIKGK